MLDYSPSGAPLGCLRYCSLTPEIWASGVPWFRSSRSALNVSALDSQLFNTSSGSICRGKVIGNICTDWCAPIQKQTPHNSSGNRLVHVGVFQTHREDEMISGWLKKYGGQPRRKLRECNFSWHTLCWNQTMGLCLVALRAEPAVLKKWLLVNQT